MQTFEKYTPVVYNKLISHFETFKRFKDAIETGFAYVDDIDTVEIAFNSIIKGLDAEIRDMEKGFSRFKKKGNNYTLSIDEFNGGLTLSTCYAHGYCVALKALFEPVKVPKEFKAQLNFILDTAIYLYDAYGAYEGSDIK